MSIFVRSHALLLALGGLAALTAAPVYAQNLVQNGGFEDGNVFWSSTGEVSFNINGFPRTGDGYAAFYENAATLSQSVNTVSGADYTLSFFLNTADSADDTLNVLINGQSLTSGLFHPAQGALGAYTGFTLDFTGPGGPTDLEFAGNVPANDGTAYRNLRIDDVSLTMNTVRLTSPVPEASTTISFGLLLTLGGLVLMARKRKTRAAV